MRDVNIALISLLLKKDEDPVTDCSSYRSLSFDRLEWSFLLSVLGALELYLLKL